MSVDTELISRITQAEGRLERLESREQRRLITDYDWLRGSKDDFLGRSLDVRYEQLIVGGGSSIALQALHGGQVRLRIGAVLFDQASLVLGASADTYTSLDADAGWVQMWRASIGNLTEIQATGGGYEWTTGTHIYAGFRPDVSAANWILRCMGPGTTNVDTGVAADTNYHWHALEVYPITGGRQADYYLDGILIGSCSTVNVTGDLLSPALLTVNRVGGNVRQWNVDFWAVIPRNLI